MPSCGLPGSRTRRADLILPYLALLQAGFVRLSRLRDNPWSLTPRFHPCRCPPEADRWAVVFCDTFRRIAPPPCYGAPRLCGARTFLILDYVIKCDRLTCFLPQFLYIQQHNFLHPYPALIIRGLFRDGHAVRVRLGDARCCYFNKFRLFAQFLKCRGPDNSHPGPDAADELIY